MKPFSFWRYPIGNCLLLFSLFMTVTTEDNIRYSYRSQAWMEAIAHVYVIVMNWFKFNQKWNSYSEDSLKCLNQSQQKPRIQFCQIGYHGNQIKTTVKMLLWICMNTLMKKTYFLQNMKNYLFFTISAKCCFRCYGYSYNV